MIEYLEIRNTARAVIGILDTAKSVIWNIEYFGVGDFEIYAPFTASNAAMLQKGYFVTRTNEKNVGVIENISVSYNVQDGQMITASGRFAKAIIAQRLIYAKSGNSIAPVISSGNVEEAARALVNSNIIAASDAARNIDFIELGALAGLAAVIVDANGNATQKQTSFDNLQEYTDAMLQEYNAGAYVGIDRQTLQLQYIVYAGTDRSADNTAGNDPLIFSQDFDNLLATNYLYNDQQYKNTALIGGEGEGAARYFDLLDGGSGIERREIFIDGSDQARTYKDSSGNDAQYSDTVYSQMLLSKARQELAAMIVIEAMNGEIDLTNSGLTLGAEFYCGDVITIQDNKLGKYANARILKVTEVQDDGGYNISVEFGE